MRKIDRKEFITQVGKGAAFALIFGCVSACKKKGKEDDKTQQPAPSSVDFTIDITDVTYADLQNPSIGWIYYDKILVAKKTDGTYIAVYKICTHEAAEMFFLANDESNTPVNQFVCSNHGDTFDTMGNPQAGQYVLDIGKSLQTYITELSGNMLRVHS